MSGLPDHIGIVGCGAMGRFLANDLANHSKVKVFDPRPDLDAGGLDRVDSISELCVGSDAVVTAVPFASLAAALAEIDAPLVIDISSVRSLPDDHLAKLPSETVGMHPMFGPPSQSSITPGLPLVITNVTGKAAQDFVKAFVETFQLKEVRMTADEHDQFMANSQALPFFLSKVLGEMNIPELPEDVTFPTYEILRSLELLAQNNSEDLYQSILEANPFAETAISNLVNTAKTEQAKHSAN